MSVDNKHQIGLKVLVRFSVYSVRMDVSK